MRSVMAIVAAFLTVALLGVATDYALAQTYAGSFDESGHTRDIQVFALLLVAWAVRGLIGGYVAASVARRAEVQHALILGCTLLITNVPNTISRWREFPVWLHLATALVIVPAAVLGGYLRSRQVEGRRDSFVQVR